MAEMLSNAFANCAFFSAIFHFYLVRVNAELVLEMHEEYNDHEFYLSIVVSRSLKLPVSLKPRVSSNARTRNNLWW